MELRTGEDSGGHGMTLRRLPRSDVGERTKELWDEPADLIVQYTDIMQGVSTTGRFIIFTEWNDDKAAELVAELHMKVLLDQAGVEWR